MLTTNITDQWLFLFAYILSIGVFGILLYSSGISLLKPSIPMVFFWSYLILSYAGFPFMVFEFVSSAAWINVTDSSVIVLTWFYSAVSLLLVVTGIVIAKHILKIDTATKKSISNNMNVSIVAVIILCLISGISLLIYLQNVPSVALFDYLEYGDEANTALSRSNATNALSNAWRYQFFTKHITPFLSYATLAALVMTARKRYLFVFAIAFILSSFATVMNFTRSAFPIYFSSVLFVYILSKNISISSRIIIVGLFIVTPFLLYIFAVIAKTDIVSAIRLVVERLLAGTPEAAYFYVMIFPNILDYLNGLSLPNPGGILPFEHFRVSVFVSQYIWSFAAVYGGGPPEGVVGSAPAMFWTEMYANFGLSGIIISSLIFGGVLWTVHAYVSRLPAHPIVYALITYIAFYIRPVSTSFLSNIMVPVEPIIVCILAYVLYRLSVKKSITEQ